MFSDERAFTYRNTSAFVPSSKVHEANGHSTLTVEVLLRDTQTFALLPTEYHEVIAVDPNDLR